MTTLDLLLPNALEKAIQVLLSHFQEQYGKAIFLPLGVKKDKTPARIVPQLAWAFQSYLIKDEGEKAILLLEEERIAKVFDSFMESFFNSLNLLGRKLFITLKMKMSREDLTYQLQIKKEKAPQTAIKRKENLMLILETLFTTVIQELKAQQYSLERSWTSSLQEQLHQLKIFE